MPATLLKTLAKEPQLAKIPKSQWDAWVNAVGVESFLEADPLGFPHRYMALQDWRHAECVAVLSALMSYGNRATIRQVTEAILAPMGPEPLTWLAEQSPNQLRKAYRGWVHRFYTSEDLLSVLIQLQRCYDHYGSLKAVWQACYDRCQGDLPSAITCFRSLMLGVHAKPEQWTVTSAEPELTYGLRFMWANPVKGSSAKRFNMLLRWLVRDDALDLGLWKGAMPTSGLIFPLDVHVATQARQLKLLTRKSNDWKAAEEITRQFRRLDPSDPVKYDLALFGRGLSQKQAQKKSARSH